MSISIANGVISGDPGNGMYEDYLREKNIKPHPVQEQLLSLPDEIFEPTEVTWAWLNTYDQSFGKPVAD